MKHDGYAYSGLGAKIRLLRKDLGMTQADVSNGIVTRNMLSRIENGEVLPSLGTLNEIASRLGVSVGYLIDDSDDGSEQKNMRMLGLIKDEYAKCNYELCLQYLDNLEDFSDEKTFYTAMSLYKLGVDMIFADHSIQNAQKYISDALKYNDVLPQKLLNEGKVYRALLNGFSSSFESGGEESTFIDLKNYADYSCDLAIFSGVINVKGAYGCDYADAMLANSVFENTAYFKLLKGSILLDNGDYNNARASLIVSLSGELPSPIRCYCLTLLEKSCAASNDFENAYNYMDLRRQLCGKILKKP